MKPIIKIYTTLLLMTVTIFLPQQTDAQAPEKMSYQAVVRDASNNLISSTDVGMRIQILQGSELGTVVYEETQTPTSNTNGLVSLEIGAGTVLSGDFTTIDWTDGPYFIKTETDPNGGTDYTISGTSQLLSVPYALYAKESGSSPNLWTESGSDIHRQSGNVGIGTNNFQPNFRLNVDGGTFLNTSTGNLTLGFTNNGNQWRLNTQGSGANLLFQSKPNGSGAVTTRVAFRQDGEVQIGTSGTPTAWTHIRANSSVSKTTLFLQESENDYARLSFGSTSNTARWHIASIGEDGVSGSANSQMNFFFTNDQGAANRMIITGDGQVGINGTPSARLHILQQGQSVGDGLRISDPFSDWDISSASSLRFHYNGDLRGFISFNTGAYNQSSDQSLKTNIAPIAPVMNRIKALNVKTYSYNTDPTNEITIGLLAQEAKYFFPELVSYSEADELYGINYAGFSMVAIKAIQEQQVIIENQNKKIKDLENSLNEILNKLSADLTK